jgi:glycosyltransferase involved in cell wall biosynthesis
MLPQQSKDMVPQILAASDACMVLLRRTELFKTVIPSKIFEAMAMERPILLGVEGESRGIIERSECGIAVEPENAAALAEGVMALCSDPERAASMGRNGAAWVRRHYNRDALAARYLDILTDVRSGRRHFAESASPITANDGGTR